jgi:hypothetical protein
VALHKIVAADTAGNDTTATSLAGNDTGAAMSITFDTGPLTVTIGEEHLRDLHRVVKVDEAGNAVAFNTISIAPQECPSGFLGGQWRPVDHRPGGIFRGRWISHNGVHAGYLRGVYGTTSDGENMFFGKWIKSTGQFRGLLIGHYGNNTDVEPGGWFRGIWLNRNLKVGGELGGVWATRDDAERPGGFFKGRWKAQCVTPEVKPD